MTTTTSNIPMTTNTSTSTSTSMSNQIRSILDSITIPHPQNEESHYETEKKLKQSLKSDFNFGPDVDSELYDDLARAFLRWKVRSMNNKSSTNHSNSNSRMNGNSQSHSNINSNSSIRSRNSKGRSVRMGKSILRGSSKSLNIDDDDDDSDLSIESTNTSQSLLTTSSPTKPRERDNLNKISNAFPNLHTNANIHATINATINANVHANVHTDMHGRGCGDEYDSDLDDDVYISANESSDVEEMKERDREVVEEISAMNIDDDDNSNNDVDKNDADNDSDNNVDDNNDNVNTVKISKSPIGNTNTDIGAGSGTGVSTGTGAGIAESNNSKSNSMSSSSSGNDKNNIKKNSNGKKNEEEFMSNNLLREFELMGTSSSVNASKNNATNSTTNNYGKENEEPQDSSVSPSQSPSPSPSPLLPSSLSTQSSEDVDHDADVDNGVDVVTGSRTGSDSSADEGVDPGVRKENGRSDSKTNDINAFSSSFHKINMNNNDGTNTNTNVNTNVNVNTSTSTSMNNESKTLPKSNGLDSNDDDEQQQQQQQQQQGDSIDYGPFGMFYPFMNGTTEENLNASTPTTRFKSTFTSTSTSTPMSVFTSKNETNENNIFEKKTVDPTDPTKSSSSATATQSKSPQFTGMPKIIYDSDIPLGDFSGSESDLFTPAKRPSPPKPDPKQKHQFSDQPFSAAEVQSFNAASLSSSSMFNVGMNDGTKTGFGAGAGTGAGASAPKPSFQFNAGLKSSNVGMNAGNEDGAAAPSSKPDFQFNVDLRSSKTGHKRGSPRLRRSRVNKSSKKISTPLNAKTDFGIGTNLGVGTDTKFFSTPEVAPTSTVSPKNMDIDTPFSPSNNLDVDGPVFNIGTGTPTKKPTPSKKVSQSFRRQRSSVKAKNNLNMGASIRNQPIPPTPENKKTYNDQETIFKSSDKSSNEAVLDARLELTAKTRENAKALYAREFYKESVAKFTEAILLLTNNFTSVPKPLKRPEESEVLAALYGNRAAALMMVGAFDAASVDCNKAIKHLRDYNPLAFQANNEASLMSYLRTDGGLTLMSKLSARMGRAHMKLGNIDEAEKAIEQTIRIAKSATVCHQKIQDYATKKGLQIPYEMRQLAEKVLIQCKADATLNLSDLRKMKSHIEAINSIGGVIKDTESKQAGIRNKQIYHRIDDILKIAPANVEMQESKVLCLASMRRWSKLASYCEDIACKNASSGEAYIEDLMAANPFPGLTPSGSLPNTIRTRALNPKQVAEAVLWMPKRRVVPLYIRSLRLEEKYLEASKACNALASLPECDEPVFSPTHKKEKKWRQWIEKEREKINCTMLRKEDGDVHYRKGNYRKAAELYASALLIDSEKLGFFSQCPAECETAGGRLHAVLHCNRAACLMPLSQFEEATKECTAALRIHRRYMKAMLRRARCFFRVERYEESISEYNRWSGLVQEAKANPYARSEDECPFDRAFDVSDADYQKTMGELLEVKKVKFQKDENERQAAENIRKRASSASFRRQQWYDQQHTDGPRRWDSFNGTSPKKDKNDFANGSRSFRQTRRSKPKSTNFRQQRTEQQRKPEQQQKKSPKPSPRSNSVTCHYAVLQVKRKATQIEIKKAYHKMALKYHPDKNTEAGAGDIFRKVKLAYETLKDERSRRMYDIERLRQRSQI